MPTFIVRLQAAGSRTLCGEAQHVVTGESIRFTSVAQLLDFFEEMSAVSPPIAGAGRPNPSVPPAEARNRKDRGQPAP
jgi:hypothetical protein